MTQAQSEAHLCGMVPENNDPLFFAQHLSAYAFAKPLAAGGRVLEVGFGDGYGSHYLAQGAAEVSGVDVAPGNIERASAKYSRPNLRFQHMDGTRLQFPDEMFDLVCSFQVIEHIPEPQLPSHLSEISRVLKPTGVYCVSTLNLAHAMKPGKPYHKLCYHEKEFSALELSAFLAQVFPDVRLYGLHLTWWHRLYRRMKKWGMERWGPASMNPIGRFYARASVHDFIVRPDVSRAALDLIGVCRKVPAESRLAC